MGWDQGRGGGLVPYKQSASSNQQCSLSFKIYLTQVSLILHVLSYKKRVFHVVLKCAASLEGSRGDTLDMKMPDARGPTAWILPLLINSCRLCFECNDI